VCGGAKRLRFAPQSDAWIDAPDGHSTIRRFFVHGRNIRGVSAMPMSLRRGFAIGIHAGRATAAQPIRS
jgi:hypothetical protein